jgi:phosphatidylserine/phosphatidylglycerophosphate/cardiolipin synthase-like enzyme
MNEINFYKKLMESIEYGKYEEKSKVIKILKNSYITFNKTRDFTKKSWQSWEYVELRIPIPYLDEVENYRKYLESLVYDIYEECEEYDIGGLIFKRGKSVEELDEIILKEVHFEDIQNQIINELRDAKYTIWITVAWFTDSILFKELLNKRKQGLNIQIIVNDDNINRNHGCDYEKYFETYRIPESGYFKNIMHNKFCVIDLKTVIHGSYNWSKKAQYNQETITIDNDRKLAEQFADEFFKIKLGQFT